MKWRGVEIKDLDDTTVLEALDAALKISGELWREVARRGLIREATVNSSSLKPLDTTRRR